MQKIIVVFCLLASLACGATLPQTVNNRQDTVKVPPAEIGSEPESPYRKQMLVCNTNGLGLNVRAGAGTEYDLVTTTPLKDGIMVTLSGQERTHAGYQWYAISGPVNGWVSSIYLCPIK